MAQATPTIRLTYEYTNIIPGLIRIFTLLPETETGTQISGHLTEESLDNCPPYDALSYHWGADNELQAIELDRNRTFRITKNLLLALFRLRHLTKTRNLWIDAICINQSDILEKNMQIPLMTKIYQNASTTVVYLGEEANCSSTVPSLLHKISRIFGKADYHLVEQDLSKFGLPDRDDLVWMACGRFLERPWFHRVWVVQEVIVSKQVIAVCGSLEIPLPLLGYAAQVMASYPMNTLVKGTEPAKRTEAVKSALRMLRFVALERSETQIPSYKPKSKLFDVMHLGRYLDASDERDHAFALLGLATDGQCEDVRPDYGETVQEVFCRLATYFVMQGQGINLLYEAGYTTDLAVPSWVPDWRSENILPDTITSSMSTSSFERIAIQNAYSASGTSNPHVEISDNPLKLIVRGILIDRIWKIGTNLRTDAAKRLSVLEKLRIWLLDLDDISKDVKIFPDGQSIEEIKWRTCIRDRLNIKSNESPDSSFGLQYTAFRRFYGAVFASEVSDDDKSLNSHLALPFWDAIKTFGRKFCLTQRGLFGETNLRARKDDWICVFLGSSVPYVIRHIKGNEYSLVGDCYFHGIMNGEAVVNDSHKVEDIVLV